LEVRQPQFLTAKAWIALRAKQLKLHNQAAPAPNGTNKGKIKHLLGFLVQMKRTPTFDGNGIHSRSKMLLSISPMSLALRSKGKKWVWAVHTQVSQKWHACKSSKS